MGNCCCSDSMGEGRCLHQGGWAWLLEDTGVIWHSMPGGILLAATTESSE